MANSENLDLKRLDEPKASTKFNHQIYYQNNFDKIDAAVGAPPSTLTTTQKTLVPAINELKSDKVDKVTGKGLSTNDYTTTEKNKLAGIPADTATQLSGKVDKVTGKGLSTNDFDNTYKQKIDIDIPAQLADKVPQTRTVNGKALSIDVSVTAADVPNTPAGGIAASTVQAAINELDTEKANKVQEAWITPTFINGASGNVEYMKDSFGFVHFKGAVIAPTGWSNGVFVMPVGYRLSATQFMFGRNVSNAPTLVQFMNAAKGVWVGSSASSVAVSLDGMHYLAEA